jgi:FixJ family two-component response regulator
MDGASAGTVFIVDDAREIRMALKYVLKRAGYRVRSFESAARFLAARDADTPGCLLLDNFLPRMSGLELHRLLLGSPLARPTVFLTERGSIETAVQAMKAGAVDFLTKPIDDDRLIAAVEEALRRDAAERRARAICETIQKRLEALTQRERDVMELVISGRPNRQIGVHLGIREKTVKVHRMRVMKKMGVRSVAQLVRLSASVGIEHEFPNNDYAASNSSTGAKDLIYDVDLQSAHRNSGRSHHSAPS